MLIEGMVTPGGAWPADCLVEPWNGLYPAVDYLPGTSLVNRNEDGEIRTAFCAFGQAMGVEIPGACEYVSPWIVLGVSYYRAGEFPGIPEADDMTIAVAYLIDGPPNFASDFPYGSGFAIHRFGYEAIGFVTLDGQQVECPVAADSPEVLSGSFVGTPGGTATIWVN